LLAVQYLLIFYAARCNVVAPDLPSTAWLNEWERNVLQIRGERRIEREKKKKKKKKKRWGWGGGCTPSTHTQQQKRRGGGGGWGLTHPSCGGLSVPEVLM
jgi:hypothetical protein